MKKTILNFFLFSFFMSPVILFAQSKKADKQTFEWRYEIEAVGAGVQGTYQIKVWSYSKKPETAIEQAKKNAVHGIIFRGFADRDRIKGQRPLAQSPSLEQEKEEFFKDFFQEGGKYQKFISVINNGVPDAADRMKIGKEYKIGIIVSVNVTELRKDLESAGIIKGLGSGF
jgi:hypothetical protein